MAQVESRNRATSSEESRKEVAGRIKKEQVEFVLLWFTDIEGHLKSFAVTPSEIEDALDDGMGFDGSSITGFNAIEESDMVAIPDPETFQLMPWKESCAMDERLRFISEYQSGDWTVTELSERHEVSRKTAYKWLERYREFGVAGLAEQPRRPHTPGRATPAHLVEAILSLRRERPTWGPRKIIAKLSMGEPEAGWLDELSEPGRHPSARDTSRRSAHGAYDPC